MNIIAAAAQGNVQTLYRAVQAGGRHDNQIIGDGKFRFHPQRRGRAMRGEFYDVNRHKEAIPLVPPVDSLRLSDLLTVLLWSEQPSRMISIAKTFATKRMHAGFFGAWRLAFYEWRHKVRRPVAGRFQPYNHTLPNRYP